VFSPSGYPNFLPGQATGAVVPEVMKMQQLETDFVIVDGVVVPELVMRREGWARGDGSLRASGAEFAAVDRSTRQLAKALKPNGLAKHAFALYEKLTPGVARGQRAGQRGELDLSLNPFLGPRACRRRHS
jgi:hypothetical protein